GIRVPRVTAVGACAPVSSVGTASHGTVSINANGTLDYTPGTDFHGTDSFSYTVTTAAGDTETATVTVTVSAVVDALDDTVSTARADESPGRRVEDETLSAR